MQTTAGMQGLVTGAASGIGRAVAQRCIERGMHVYLLDVEAAALEETAAHLGTRCTPIHCDVSDAASVGAAAEQVDGPVALLVNNAGVGTYGPPIWELTRADWQWVLGVNLWGTINCLTTFLPAMLRRDEGHVVNVASAAGLMSPPGFGPYNASKHAIVTISETLHHELRRAGFLIGVTLALPGMVRTRMPNNERNRPAMLANPTAVQDERADRYRDTVAAMTQANEAGRDPLDVADAIMGAVEDDRFYLILDDWVRAGAEQRMREIVHGHTPTSPE